MKLHLLTSLMLLTCAIGKGQSFTPLTSGVTNVMSDLSFADASIGYSIGTGGLILKTTNGGTTWVAQTSGVTEDLHDVEFTDALTGYVIGNNGTILKTTNGGTTWSPLSSGVSADLRGVYIFGASMFLTGKTGTIRKSTDGGSTWTSCTTGTSNTIYDVVFTDVNTGYASGASIILKSTDAGVTWTTIYTSPDPNMALQSVDFTDLNNGCVVGGNHVSSSGVILRTTNAGSTWNTVLSPSTDYLADIEFINSSVGYAAGGNITSNTSTIYKTMDAGATWSTVFSSGNRLTGICLADASAGYACGLSGSILKASNIDNVNESINETLFDIYPNPASNNITITINNAQTSTVSIAITNGIGQQVWAAKEAPAKNMNVNVEHLSRGVYFVKVNAGDKILTKKLVIN